VVQKDFKLFWFYIEKIVQACVGTVLLEEKNNKKFAGGEVGIIFHFHLKARRSKVLMVLLAALCITL
jgi:hypothetical protein